MDVVVTMVVIVGLAVDIGDPVVRVVYGDLAFLAARVVVAVPVARVVAGNELKFSHFL